MNVTIYCLVDADGKEHVTDGAESHSDLAAKPGPSEKGCQQYRFDLTDRRLLTECATPAGSIAAQAYLNERVGTPEKLMHFAEDGHLSKGVMVNLLELEKRRPYLAACAAIERKYTEECGTKDDTCLESGCSIDRAAGEVCLQPLLRAGTDYQKACAAEWVRLFRTPANRIEAWKN